MSNFIPNSFQVPNALIDDLLCDLSGAELKIYLTIARKTKGWNKEFDAISISQFKNLTGLSNRSVINACDSLIEKGLLIKKTGIRKVSVFALNLCNKFTSEKSSPVKKVHSTCEKSSQDPVKKVHTQSNTIKIHSLEKQKENTKEKNTKGKSDLEILKDFGIVGDLAKDFIKVRKSKGKTITVSAMNRNLSQAEKAGISLQEAIEFVVLREWQGFTASYYFNAIKQSESTDEIKDFDYLQLLNEYNAVNDEYGSPLPDATEITPSRKRAITEFLNRLKKPTIECAVNYFYAYFENLTDWQKEKRVDLEYAMSDRTVLKVREGTL